MDQRLAVRDAPDDEADMPRAVASKEARDGLRAHLTDALVDVGVAELIGVADDDDGANATLSAEDLDDLPQLGFGVGAQLPATEVEADGRVEDDLAPGLL